jgi:flagellar FliL protein
VLGILSEFSEEDVQGTNGKAALASALKEGINSKLTLLENFGGVQEVLFTSFVLN